MKKVKSILIIMLFMLFPNIVQASSNAKVDSMSLEAALRNGSICFITYVIFCIKTFI